MLKKTDNSYLVDKNAKNTSKRGTYFLATKPINKEKETNEIVEKKCHSDFTFRMNTNIFSPKILNFSEMDVDTVKEKKKEKDLDYYMDKKIHDNLEKKYNSKRFHQINQNFYNHLKKEDFDKKEFSYCRKMLLMKKKEILKENPADNEQFSNNLRTNKQLEKEAEVELKIKIFYF